MCTNITTSTIIHHHQLIKRHTAAHRPKFQRTISFRSEIYIYRSNRRKVNCPMCLPLYREDQGYCPRRGARAPISRRQLLSRLRAARALYRPTPKTLCECCFYIRFPFFLAQRRCTMRQLDTGMRYYCASGNRFIDGHVTKDDFERDSKRKGYKFRKYVCELFANILVIERLLYIQNIFCLAIISTIWHMQI